ncbi:virus protein of unknown function [Streptococcus gallolyticus]|uniref:Phage structural protein n=1 Tax=Streptococcus gallolyticus TaxID=315405 RepID=A0A1I7JH46_9STRE|nr:DUF859 family phage minor structural protein [Streptococcus gallolyticus]SFC83414.1 virus protein of unknown function [Streptococcus gallolyticus]SFU84491.1 virus protein of unknown function [Streptococcus gallolyticus]
MATATFSGSYGHNMTLEVWSDWNRQDVASNSSTVNVQARLRTNGYASMWGVTAPVTVTVNGKSESSTVTVNVGTNSTLLFFGKDYKVAHNGDGTKTVGISISVNLNTGGYGSATASFNLTLPTIPRASDVSAASGTIGSAMTINISRKSSSFTHTVKYSFGSKSGTIATGVGTSVSWTPPNDLATVIPNATSGLGGITVETYNGSTKIGSKSAQLTLNVPSSMKPTFTGITLSDNNTTVQNLIPDGNTFVEILSLIKVTFNGASGIQGSTIKGYKAELVNNNQTVTSNGGAFGIIRKTGEITVRASVQDSRGYWSNTRDTKITLLEYFSPLNSFKVERSSSARTTLTVTRTAKIAPLTVNGKQLNKMTISFKTRLVGTTTWTVNNGSASGTFTTVSELLNSSANLAGTFAGTQSWEVYGEVEDLFDKTAFSAIVSTDSVLVSKTKNGLGVGKIRERGMLDVGGDIYANNQQIEFVKGGTVSDDANNLVTSGAYKPSSNTNLPTGASTHGQLLVVRGGGDTISQIYMPYNESNLYIRTANNIGKDTPNWKAWTTFARPNTVTEFTAVNQTKVYTATIPGPYGLSITARRVGNIVNGTINTTFNSTGSWSGTASETLPSGWRPVTEQKFTLLGHAGGGTGTQVWSTQTFADLTYKASGAIDYTIRTQDNPIAFFGSFTWITSDPFPS